VAQGQVVRARDIRPPQRDQQGALHGPRADPLHRGELPDHLLIGQLAQLGLGQAPIVEALRQIQDGGSLAP
jgi:hypothetical protein